jgi:hypothetical protein
MSSNQQESPVFRQGEYQDNIIKYTDIPQIIFLIRLNFNYIA